MRREGFPSLPHQTVPLWRLGSLKFVLFLFEVHMKSSASLSLESIEQFGRTLFLAALRQHGVRVSAPLPVHTLQRLLHVLEEEHRHIPPSTPEVNTHE